MHIAKLNEGDVRALTSGQIITDPVSIVKELLENSLDAGANSIIIHIDGLEEISVKDNGSGIGASDAQSLAQPHYTSKISSYADLMNVRSYGFRGEALFAIAELSRSFQVTSRTDQDSVARKYERDSSCVFNIVKTTGDLRGTSIRVEKPWYRIPVRREKFLKELGKLPGRLRQLVQKYSFVRLDVRFQLVLKSTRKGQRSDVMVLAPQQTLLDSLAQVFGQEAIRQCDLHLQEYDRFCITAVLPRREAKPLINAKGYLIYFDNRPVSCSHDFMKRILKLVRSTIIGSCPFVTHDPLMFLNFCCPPGSYDPNLEPNKDAVMVGDPDRFLKLVETFLDEVYKLQTHDPDSSSLVQQRNPEARTLMIPAQAIAIEDPTSALNDSLFVDLVSSSPEASNPQHQRPSGCESSRDPEKLVADNVEQSRPSPYRSPSSSKIQNPSQAEDLTTPRRKKSWKFSMFDDEESSDHEDTGAPSTCDGFNPQIVPVAHREAIQEEEEDFIADRPALSNPWTIARMNARPGVQCELSSDVRRTFSTPTPLSSSPPTVRMRDPISSDVLSPSMQHSSSIRNDLQSVPEKRPNLANTRTHEQLSARKKQKPNPSATVGQSVISEWLQPSTSLIKENIRNEPVTQKAKVYDSAADTTTRKPTFKSPLLSRIRAGPVNDLDHPFSGSSDVTRALAASSMADQGRRPTASLPLERSKKSDQVHDLSRTTTLNFQDLEDDKQVGTYDSFSTLSSTKAQSLEHIVRLQLVSEISGGMLLFQALDTNHSLLALFMANRDKSLEKRIEELLDSEFRDMKMTGDSDGFIRLW